MTPRPHRPGADPPSAPQSAPRVPAPRIDQILEALILGLLLYMPLAFGGVMPLSRVVLAAAGCLIAACFAVRCVSETDREVSTPRAMLPIAGLLALVGLQLVDLPAGLLGTVSPRAAELWTQAADAAGRTLPAAPLSVYPHATALQLDVLVLAALLMLTAATVYRDRAAFKRLLAGVALIGVAVVLVNLGHLVLGEDRSIYGVFDGGATSGAPFASYSHFSEFVNLALGCALGYLLVTASGRVSGRTLDVRDLVSSVGRKPSRLERVLTGFLLLGAVAIVLSTSRNGLISMVFAAAVTSAAMQYSRRVDGVGWSIAGIGLGATVVLLLLGVDPVIERFEAISAEGVGGNTRLDLIRDSAAMAMAFAAAGAGLGTFALAFPGFDTAQRPGTAEHAENQYMEVLAELGLVGALLAATFLVLLSVRLVKRTRESRNPADLGVFGVVFGLAAVGFHSLTDFGLVIPGVGLAAATLAGAGLGRSSRDHSSSLARRVPAMAAAVLALGVLGTSLPPAVRSSGAWDHFVYAERVREEVERAGGVGTEAQHRTLVEHTGLAAAGEATNAEYRFRSVLARWTGAVAGAQGFDPEAEPVTPLTHPELVDAATAAVEELREVLLLAPTHGPSWSVAGQLRRIWLDDQGEEAGRWILRGRELAPHHPATALASAFELMRQEREDEGVLELERAVRVGAARRDVVDLLAVSLQRPRLALPFVERDLPLTGRLLDVVRGLEGEAALAEDLSERFEALLLAACARPDASEGDLQRLAGIERGRGNLEEAAELYRRILSVNPASRARFNYARILVDLGDVRGARRELRDVLDFNPGLGAATRLLEKLEAGSGR
ncbi:MAG: O-antigen ligase family protein [Planctomycetota bacterium]|jgi:tetratricopeptide (TPR) repeat protein